MSKSSRDIPQSDAADPFDLERFIVAQDAGHVYEQALDEMRRGRKTSHWMWFVFPQLAGLGHSETARRFAIRSLDEARAYLAHPVLGSRLRESSAVIAEAPGDSADAILGGIDAQKLRSSMTLFAAVSEKDTAFLAVLDRWYDGLSDEATGELLRRLA